MSDPTSAGPAAVRMRVRDRLMVATLIFAVVLVPNIVVRSALHAGSADLYFPLCAARAWLGGQDPYGGACPMIEGGRNWPTNPMTTVLFAIPFLPFQPYAAAVMTATGSALLAFALLKDGQRWRLLTLLAAPFAEAVLFYQWSPWLCAFYLLPRLSPLALVKPHTGLPVILTRLTVRRAIAAGGFLALTLILFPTWPLRWWQTASGSYGGYLPLLILPEGLLLVLALVKWRSESGRLLALMSVAPQAWFHDSLPLFLLPSTRRQLVRMITVSWIGYAVLMLSRFPYRHAVLLGCYLPALLVVVPPSAVLSRLRWRGRREAQEA